MGYTNTVENAQPSTSDSTDVLRQLTEGVSRPNERIEETNNLARQEFDRKKEKGDEKKDRISKLHSSFLKMLLNASSKDGERAATGVSQRTRWGNQFPHSSMRCRNFKILRSMPQRLHHGIYQYSGELPTIDIGLN